MEKKWCVFDEADCFDEFDAVEGAADLADSLVKQGFEGVHILHLTQPQFIEYCTHGDLKAALKT